MTKISVVASAEDVHLLIKIAPLTIIAGLAIVSFVVTDHHHRGSIFVLARARALSKKCNRCKRREGQTSTTSGPHDQFKPRNDS